jgi:hypothetical protein
LGTGLSKVGPSCNKGIYKKNCGIIPVFGAKTRVEGKILSFFGFYVCITNKFAVVYIIRN